MKALNIKEMSPLLKDPYLAFILGSIPVSLEDIIEFLDMPKWKIKIEAYEIGEVGQYLMANKVGFIAKYGRCKTMEEAINMGFRDLEKISKQDRLIQYFPTTETEGQHQSA